MTAILVSALKPAFSNNSIRAPSRVHAGSRIASLTMRDSSRSSFAKARYSFRIVFEGEMNNLPL
ncbi:Uncharacterised protein [Vibrio cholerae]|nr:Uncharacterised protein [Vibrio cholerae]CSI88033.1 Uncharacterised protein [Vibrio cholerae]